MCSVWQTLLFARICAMQHIHVQARGESDPIIGIHIRKHNST